MCPVKSKINHEQGEGPDLDDVSEQRIQEIVRYLWNNVEICIFKEDDLAFEIIKLIKCDLKEARNIIEKMKRLGLSVCKSISPFYHYDLERFGLMRGYILKSEVKEFEEIERQFFDKYGEDKSIWSDKVWEEFEKMMSGDEND